MNWLFTDIPPFWQWFGWLATIAGTCLALWAALSAKGAKQQAREAKEAAIRLGRVLELSDLINDLHELDAMIARAEFQAIAAKSGHLLGRVVRFKAETYNLLSATQSADLDRAREQLEQITRAAAKEGTAKDATRIGRIQIGVAEVNECLNRVFAIHHAGRIGDK